MGYGMEKGEQFWLIKNSWGAGWGEGDFIRLRQHLQWSLVYQ